MINEFNEDVAGFNLPITMWMRWVWRGRIGKCVPKFWEIGGAIWTNGRRPEVRIAPPILKNEVRIYRCARARLTAFTLLLVNWSQLYLHQIHIPQGFKIWLLYLRSGFINWLMLSWKTSFAPLLLINLIENHENLNIEYSKIKWTARA